jgi:hypothetical protein
MKIMFNCLDWLFELLNSRYGREIREVLCFTNHQSFTLFVISKMLIIIALYKYIYLILFIYLNHIIFFIELFLFLPVIYRYPKFLMGKGRVWIKKILMGMSKIWIKKINGYRYENNSTRTLSYPLTTLFVSELTN